MAGLFASMFMVVAICTISFGVAHASDWWVFVIGGSCVAFAYIIQDVIYGNR